MNEQTHVTNARAKAAEQWHISGVVLTSRQEYWREFWKWNGAPRQAEPHTPLGLHGIREVELGCDDRPCDTNIRDYLEKLTA